MPELYNNCAHCSQWISSHNHYVVVEDGNGSLFHLHDNPCRERWFDNHHGRVIQEHIGIERCATAIAAQQLSCQS